MNKLRNTILTEIAAAKETEKTFNYYIYEMTILPIIDDF